MWTFAGLNRPDSVASERQRWAEATSYFESSHCAATPLVTSSRCRRSQFSLGTGSITRSTLGPASDKRRVYEARGPRDHLARGDVPRLSRRLYCDTGDLSQHEVETALPILQPGFQPGRPAADRRVATRTGRRSSPRSG